MTLKDYHHREATKRKRKRKHRIFTEEHLRNLARAWTTSPILLARKEAAKEKRELKRQAREAREAKKLLKRTTAIYIAAWKKEHAAELALEKSRKISEALTGRPHPWNEGVKAWNNGLQWSDETKQRISNGMKLYWTLRKEREQQ